MSFSHIWLDGQSQEPRFLSRFVHSLGMWSVGQGVRRQVALLSLQWLRSGKDPLAAEAWFKWKGSVSLYSLQRGNPHTPNLLCLRKLLAVEDSGPLSSSSSTHQSCGFHVRSPGFPSRAF